MADRKTKKVASAPKSAPPKRPDGRRGVPAGTPVPRAPTNPLEAAVERLEAALAEMKRGREKLEAELAQARARIAALDEARVDAINRLDWAIDSLHGIGPKKP